MRRWLSDLPYEVLISKHSAKRSLGEIGRIAPAVCRFDGFKEGDETIHETDRTKKKIFHIQKKGLTLLLAGSYGESTYCIIPIIERRHNSPKK